MTTLPQGDLPKDLSVLRTIVHHNQGNVGVLATVLPSGRVSRGDAVFLEERDVTADFVSPGPAGSRQLPGRRISPPESTWERQSSPCARRDIDAADLTDHHFPHARGGVGGRKSRDRFEPGLRAARFQSQRLVVGLHRTVPGSGTVSSSTGKHGRKSPGAWPADDPKIGRVFISSFSAGFGGVRELLAVPANLARIDGVILADSPRTRAISETSPLRQIDPAKMAGFRKFAAEASCRPQDNDRHCAFRTDP